jgi:excinuclease ABC subunit A
LSGGEAQRVKLATELSRRATGKTLYLLDEPTTGLSFSDCAALLGVLHRLVDTGNTVILIEHNLDIIKNSDWVIDLGPGAGDKGGKLVATGTPEQLAANAKSFTGKYLKRVLKRSENAAKPAKAKASVRKTAKTPSKSKTKEPAVAAVGD